MAITAVKDLITGFGEITYNGLTFTPLREVKIKSEMMYDDANITVTHVRFLLTVEALVFSDNVANQNSAMANIQNTLAKPGQNLVIVDIGFYTGISTAFNGDEPDLLWGAKPKTLSMEPAGGDLAWNIVWECEFNISLCLGEFSDTNNNFFAFNYEVFYSVDNKGHVTRRISGYFEIAQSRVSGGRSIIRNLEDYYDRVRFTLPLAFERVNSSRSLSIDRRRLEFSVTDRELQTLPYPDGIVIADVDFDFQNRPPGFQAWTATLSGSMEVAAGLPQSLAAAKFFLLMFDKQKSLQASAFKKDGAVIPERIRFKQQVFGGVFTFSVSFMLIACLDEILESSGIWQPFPNATYQSWENSMRVQGVGTERGYYNLRHRVSDDAIIDICAGVSAVDLGNDSGSTTVDTTPLSQKIGCANITKKTSWLLYRNKIEIVVQQNAIVHRVAQAFLGVDQSQVEAVEELLMPLSPPIVTPILQDIVQYAGAPDNLIIMTGRAVRLKFVPDVPRLLSIGGVAVTELSRNVDTEPVAVFFGCPLYVTRWAILYRAESQVKAIKPSKNRNFCITDGEDDGVK